MIGKNNVSLSCHGFELNHIAVWLSLKKIFKLSLSAMNEFKFNSPLAEVQSLKTAR